MRDFIGLYHFEVIIQLFFRYNRMLIDCVFGNGKFVASLRSIVSVSVTTNLLFPHTQSISIYYCL